MSGNLRLEYDLVIEDLALSQQELHATKYRLGQLRSQLDLAHEWGMEIVYQLREARRQLEETREARDRYKNEIEQLLELARKPRFTKLDPDYTIAEYLHAYGVECPYCGRPADHACVISKGAYAGNFAVKPHIARIRAVQKAKAS